MNPTPRPPRFGFFLGLVALGCASGPSPYRRALDEAAMAERKHDYPSAQRSYADAQRLAPRQQDADEAEYRSAALTIKTEPARGAREMMAFAATHRSSARAARAWLDAGRALEKAGDTAGASNAYATVLEQYAKTAAAEAAAPRWVELSGLDDVEAWHRLVEKNREPALEASLRYHWARALEATNPTEALSQYERVASLDPLPQGTHSDEALLRAAALRRQLGDARGAIATLEALLEARSYSFLAGSYERSAFAEARLLEARIQRDDLHDPLEAANTLDSLVSEHPLSRLVDDALFERAWTLLLAHDGAGACASSRRIESVRPDSPLSRCNALFCEDESSEPPARCCAGLPEQLPVKSCRGESDSESAK